MTVLVNRRLLPSKWRELDDLLLLVERQGVPLLVLFPGPGVCAACCCWQDAVAAHATGSATNLFHHVFGVRDVDVGEGPAPGDKDDGIH